MILYNLGFFYWLICLDISIKREEELVLAVSALWVHQHADNMSLPEYEAFQAFPRFMDTTVLMHWKIENSSAGGKGKSVTDWLTAVACLLKKHRTNQEIKNALKQ